MNVLYINDGSGNFTDETESRLPLEKVIWNNDVEFIDFDKNGFVDLFMINVDPGDPDTEDHLYFNYNGILTDSSQHLPPIYDFNHSSASADMEHDGDLDIFISVDYGKIEDNGLPDLLYENITNSSISHNQMGLSDQLMLSQNFPNPFGKTTTIRFSVPFIGEKPVNTPVTLQIFNTKGQLVKTLAQKKFSSGPHFISWNGLNSDGLQANTGVYFYKLISNNFIRTMKMFLAR